MSNRSDTLISIVLLAVLCFSVASVSAHDEAEFFNAPEFTDPAVTVEVDENWMKRPISRVKWAKESDIAVTLDQHLYPALLPLIKTYADKHKLDIAVQEGTCGISAGNLKDKHADIAGFCCPASAEDRLPGLQFHTLAIAPLAIFVHPLNNIDTLKEDQVKQVFRGDIASWNKIDPRLKGQRKLIRTVGRMHCKARPGHWRSILPTEDHFSHRMNQVSTIPDMISVVAKSPDAIGYETLWMAENHENKGQLKALKINGVSPYDHARVTMGEYPFYRVYNISTWSSDAAKNEQADKLVAYLKENFDQVDQRYGLIPFTRLRSAGWNFRNDELIGKPMPQNVAK